MSHASSLIRAGMAQIILERKRCAVSCARWNDARLSGRRSWRGWLAPDTDVSIEGRIRCCRRPSTWARARRRRWRSSGRSRAGSGSCAPVDGRRCCSVSSTPRPRCGARDAARRRRVAGRRAAGAGGDGDLRMRRRAAHPAPRQLRDGAGILAELALGADADAGEIAAAHAGAARWSSRTRWRRRSCARRSVARRTSGRRTSRARCSRRFRW